MHTRILIYAYKEDEVIITSGRSEVEGRRPRDRAERTELRIFSPTLDKSMPPPPPWKKINEVNNKTLVPSKPPSPLKRPLDANGLSASGGDEFDCISIRCTRIEPPVLHCWRRVLVICRQLKKKEIGSTRSLGLEEREREREVRSGEFYDVVIFGNVIVC